MKKIFLFTLLLALILSGCGIKPKEAINVNQIEGGFKNYALSSFKDLVFFNSADRRAGDTKNRDILGNGEYVVSVNDGYRFLYNFEDGTPFAKVFVEKSVADNFKKDRITFNRYMKDMVANLKDKMNQFQKENPEKYTLLFGNNSAIDIIKNSYHQASIDGYIINSFNSGGLISGVLIFIPKQETTITIYFPNYYSDEDNSHKDIFANPQKFKDFSIDFMHAIIDSANQ